MTPLVDNLTTRGGAIPPHRETEMKLVLSLTGDILAFRRCQRQYGLQGVRGYAVAHATQEFVGTFAHRALNRAFRRFREAGAAPSNAQMAAILEEVQQLLRDQKRRPHSWDAARVVGYRVMRLNRCFDSYGVYRRMVDTERTLQVDDGDFVIEGKVDVIQGAGDAIELWDYKATKDPRALLAARRRLGASDVDRVAARERLDDYTLQLRLYSHLHDQVHGVQPARCRLVFLNELPVPDSDAKWAEFPAEPLPADAWLAAERSMEGDSPGLFFSVGSNRDEVQQAVRSFRATGGEILEARRQDSYPAPSRAKLPDSQTCDACDLRFSCKTACEEHGYGGRG